MSCLLHSRTRLLLRSNNRPREVRIAPEVGRDAGRVGEPDDLGCLGRTDQIARVHIRRHGASLGKSTATPEVPRCRSPERVRGVNNPPGEQRERPLRGHWNPQCRVHGDAVTGLRRPLTGRFSVIDAEIARWTPESALSGRDLLREPVDAGVEDAVVGAVAFDGADGVVHGGVVTAADGLPDGFEGERCRGP